MARTGVALAQVSFYSYRSGRKIPGLVRYAYDVTNLRDPVGQPDLRQLDGRVPKVRDWISQDERVTTLKREIQLLAEMTLRGNREKYVAFGFHDHHGKWISPAVAEEAARAVEDLGFVVSVTHCELSGGGFNE